MVLKAFALLKPTIQRRTLGGRRQTCPRQDGDYQLVPSTGKIFAVGGTQNGRDGLRSVESYDPVTDTWTKAPEYAHPKSKPRY